MTLKLAVTEVAPSVITSQQASQKAKGGELSIKTMHPDGRGAMNGVFLGDRPAPLVLVLPVHLQHPHGMRLTLLVHGSFHPDTMLWLVCRVWHKG